MQKLLIISLLSIHLLGNTEFNQLLHLPYIAIHYYHHLESGDKKAFPDFIAEHYGKGDNITTDDREEQELPFMQVNHHAFPIAILPSTDPFSNASYNLSLCKNGTNYSFNKLPVGFFGSVLKPPRFIV